MTRVAGYLAAPTAYIPHVTSAWASGYVYAIGYVTVGWIYFATLLPDR